MSIFRTGISTPFHPDDLKRVPITLSLYPEYMEEADEKLPKIKYLHLLYYKEPLLMKHPKNYFNNY